MYKNKCTKRKVHELYIYRPDWIFTVEYYQHSRSLFYLSLSTAWVWLVSWESYSVDVCPYLNVKIKSDSIYHFSGFLCSTLCFSYSLILLNITTVVYFHCYIEAKIVLHMHSYLSVGLKIISKLPLWGNNKWVLLWALIFLSLKWKYMQIYLEYLSQGGIFVSYGRNMFYLLHVCWVAQLYLTLCDPYGL